MNVCSMGDSSSSFCMKSCTCISIEFLAGIIALLGCACGGVSNARNSYVWDHGDPLGKAESNQQPSAINMWYGVTGDHLSGPCICLQYLAGDIYANCFCNMNCKPSHMTFSYEPPSYALAALQGTLSFQVDCHAVSESAFT